MTAARRGLTARGGEGPSRRAPCDRRLRSRVAGCRRCPGQIHRGTCPDRGRRTACRRGRLRGSGRRPTHPTPCRCPRRRRVCPRRSSRPGGPDPRRRNLVVPREAVDRVVAAPAIEDVVASGAEEVVLPGAAETRSSPSPADTLSSPLPPRIVSSPAPPRTWSSPAPPTTVRFTLVPGAAATSSSPWPVRMTMFVPGGYVVATPLTTTTCSPVAGLTPTSTLSSPMPC